LRLLPFALLGALLLGLFGSGVGYVLRQLDLLPPESLTIAAGPRGSAYYETAMAYRAVLARDEIELEIRETQGSVDNARLLSAEEPIDIALVQGGVPLGEASEGLAAVHVEPLWVFGSGAIPEDPNRWSGLRVAAGREGSGTRLIADHLAEITGANALDRGVALASGGESAVNALLANSVDIALFIAPASAPYLEPLLTSEQVALRRLAHSEAIALRMPGARLVRLPSGILDYARSLPSQELELVALVTRLVAHEELHPALVNRLIHAVVEVHSGRGIIPADANYPAASVTDLGIEVNGYAAQLLTDGFSPIERVLPYWIAAQFNRVLLVLVPALLLLLPLLRLMPALYQAVLNRRVYRHYARVHEIDATLVSEADRLDANGIQALRSELDAIEKRLLRESLPNSYRRRAYTLLHHLDYVRRRADDLLQGT
jgi:TRAP-type uncharacterized transport system substrate-binding protein